jgi:hypothetical protein
MRMRALSSAPAAVRMRLHRKRRREGTHYVRIPLESFENREGVAGRGRDSRIYAEPCPERIEHRHELRNW